MEIKTTKRISFKASINDSHAHIGHHRIKRGLVYFSPERLDSFTKEPLTIVVQSIKQQDKVENMFVSNLDCMVDNGKFANELDGNLFTLQSSKKNSRIVPIAVCQPNVTGGDTELIKKLLDENDSKFFGLKFHPSLLRYKTDNKTIVSVDSIAYDKYLELAEEKKLPCLFHSEVKINWEDPNCPKVIKGACPSDPQYIYELAKRHPKVPVILGHTGMGGGPSHKYTIDFITDSINRNDSLLYADISWMDWSESHLPADNKENLFYFIDKLKEKGKLERILFGTDSPLGCYGEKLADELSEKKAYEKTVSSLKNAIKEHYGQEADDIIDKIFYKNANELFFEKKWAKDSNIDTAVKKISKTKIGLAIGTGVLAFAGIMFAHSPQRSPNTTIRSNSNTTDKPALQTKYNAFPSIFAKFSKK